MKTKNGFTLMNKNEIASYLAKQNVTRKITRLQVHHMDLPNYNTWEETDKKVFDEPHFGRTQSLNDYGRRTWGSGVSDGHGHYIARCTTNGLNCRKGPGTKYDTETQLNKGVAITIVAEEKVDDGGTWCKTKSGYWCNKKYLDFVRYK